MKKKKKQKGLTPRSVILGQKKYTLRKKKIEKELIKLERRLRTAEEDFRVILSKYPLSEHRRVVRSVLTHKYVSIMSLIESLNHQKTIIDEILKLFQIYLSYHPLSSSSSSKKSIRISSKIVNDNIITKFLRENVESDFRILKKAVSNSPKIYLSSLHKVRELEITSAKHLKIFTSEFSKLKKYPLLKTTEDVKDDEYMYNLRKKGFEEFLSSKRINLLEEFVKKYELLQKKKKKNKQQNNFDEAYDIFNGSLRNSSIVQYELFVEAKDHYEERIYVHAIHQESRLFNHLVDRIEHGNIFSTHHNHHQKNKNKNKNNNEKKNKNKKTTKIKHIINPKIYPWLDVKKNGVDRQFLAIVQNCAMNRVVKQNLLIDSVLENYESDSEFLNTCCLINEQIEYFYDRSKHKLYSLELDPRFLNEDVFLNDNIDDDDYIDQEFEDVFYKNDLQLNNQQRQEEGELEEEEEEEEESEESEESEGEKNILSKKNKNDLKKRLLQSLSLSPTNKSKDPADKRKEHKQILLQQLELQQNKTYQSAIKTLKKLRMKYEDIFDHMEILLILGSCCSTIGMTVHRNCTLNGEKWAFGADDFFPIVAYVLIRARIPKFVSLMRYTIEFSCQENMDLYQEFSSSRSGSELRYFSTVFDAVVDFIVQIGRNFFNNNNSKSTKKIDLENDYINWLKSKNWKNEKNLGELVNEEDSRKRIEFLRFFFFESSSSSSDSSTNRIRNNVMIVILKIGDGDDDQEKILLDSQEQSKLVFLIPSIFF